MTPTKKVHLTLVQQRAASSTDEDSNDEAKFLADLRGLVWKSQDPRGWRGLAEKARLADNTVRRFATGETKKPHLFTIRRILAAIDYVLTVVPRGKGPTQPQRKRISAAEVKVDPKAALSKVKKR